MPPSPTTLLMLCMLAATLLGGAVGACLWHLRSAGRLRRSLDDVRRRAEAERERLEAALGEERERAAAQHAEMLGTLVQTHEQAERARARHQELVAHARKQGRRIDALEAEAEIIAHAARHPAPRHETEAVPAARSSDHLPATGSRYALARDEADLPVLNRRVRGGAAAGARPDRAIGTVLDIPALFEPELLDEGESRALGSRDVRDRAPDDD